MPLLSRSASRAQRLALGLAMLPLLRFAVDLSRGFDHLMYQYLADDAFYYYEISRHIPEFNAGVPTSGFHPLYAFVVAPLHILLRWQLAVPLSLAILVLALSCSVWMVFRLVADLWDERTGLVCAATWAVSGKLYGIAMSGVETVLALLVVLLFLRRYVRCLRTADRQTTGELVRLGLLAGLAFLARMDAPLVLAPAAIYLLWTLWWARCRTAAIGLAASTVVLPLAWMGYIGLATGSVFPTSGSSLRALRGLSGRLAPPAWMVVSQTRVFLRSLPEFYARASSPILMVLLALMTLTALLAIRHLLAQRSPSVSERMRFTCLVSIGLLIWGSYYVLVQGGFRYWYYAYVALVTYVLYQPLLLANVWRWLPPRPAIWAVAVLVALVAVCTVPAPLAPQEYDKYHSALAANPILDGLSDGKRVGAFNAGIFDYFTNLDVLDLDGVVNPESAQALRDDTLPAYLRAQSVGYLIEHDLGVASNLEHIGDDSRLRLERWVDLSQYYPPYDNKPRVTVYLWRVWVVAGD